MSSISVGGFSQGVLSKNVSAAKMSVCVRRAGEELVALLTKVKNQHGEKIICRRFALQHDRRRIEGDVFASRIGGIGNDHPRQDGGPLCRIRVCGNVE